LKTPGEYIHVKRLEFCAQLIPLVQKFYLNISGSNERISLEYESHLNNGEFGNLLKASREKDIAAQRTNTGIHRDDLSFFLFENLFKSVASQGQRKSLLFACKLSEFEILSMVKSSPPLLLLDDVFEKLDELRMNNLLQYVCKKNNGQVFITDTHRDRLENALSEFANDVQIIELIN
jgi:DNA replication and repair protein RecF